MSTTKPTILHVIDTTGPGGAETVFTQLADACNHNGAHSIAVIRGPGWVQDQLIKLGVEFKVIDCKGSFNLKFLKALIHLIHDLRVTAIQSHLLGSNVYASLAGFITRVPVVSTFHGHVDVSPSERLRALKFLIIAMGSTSVVAVTKEIQSMLKKSGNQILNKKVKVIANGIDENHYYGKHTAPASLADEVTFGAVGNVREAKNYFLAVDFIEHLKNKGTNAKLVIAGDDTKALGKRLKQYIALKHLESDIKLLGFVDDVCAFFDSIDVFLMTSTSEGHPLALTQAMSYRVPILTTPSGVGEIVADEHQAFISSDHDIESLAEAFERMASKPESQLNNILRSSREIVVQEYSLGVMFERYFALYE